MKSLKNVVIILTLISITVGLVSCEKIPPMENTTIRGIEFTSNGLLTFSIAHVFGNQAIAFDTTQYQTITDTIKISELNYYVTNVTLTTEANTKVNLKNYDLVSYNPNQPTNIIVSGIPAGKYKSVTFLVGVDSVRNSSGLQTGALDPANGMFWTWNTGYIFFKVRGRFGVTGSYGLDIGGNADINGASNAMEVSFDLTPFNKTGNAATLNVVFDVQKLFMSPNIYNLRTDSNQIHNASNPFIPKLKQNIINSFSIQSLQ